MVKIDRRISRLTTLAALFLGAAVSQGRADSMELYLNTDLVGTDYRVDKVSSLVSCQSICTDENLCTGFTYNERAQLCFLKDGTYESVVAKGAISGRKLSNSTGTIDDVPAQAFTQFRGVGIGMLREHLSDALGSDFTLKGFRIVSASPKSTCGTIDTDTNGRISRLELRPCFFNADGMSLEKFARSIVDAYDISELNFEQKNMGNLVYECYVGLSHKNEQIEICNYPDEAMIGMTKVTSYRYIGMTVRPPSATGGPSFN